MAAATCDVAPTPAATCAVLPSLADLYGGITIDSTALPTDPTIFTTLLTASLQAWRAAAVRGVWLAIPIELSALIPPAVALGFTFHHTSATLPQRLVLTHWLEASPSHLPVYPSTAVGVGAFVLNAEGHLLVVQERRGPAARPGFWKLPTGLVDRGEEIADAAVREVLEETAAEVVFESVVGWRHAHGLAHGADDLFFLCICRLKDPACTALVPQASEIAAAQWMPLEEYGQQPLVRDPDTVWGHLHQLCLQAAAAGPAQLPPPAVFRPRSLPLGSRPGSSVIFTPR